MIKVFGGSEVKMNKVKILVIQGLMAVSSQAFMFDTWFVSDWQDKVTNDGFLVPVSDVAEGGTSSVVGVSGYTVTPCPENDESCLYKTDLTSVYSEVDGIVNYFESKLKVTDFVPSSQSGWGWASAGWWYIPNYDSLAEGVSIFDKAQPIELSEDIWLSLEVSYPKDEILTIELKGEDIDEDDSLQTPPRYSYFGTGSFEIVSFPMKLIKRAGWSVPTTYEVSKVTAIGMLRIVGSISKGAAFPSSEAETTNLKFKCIGLDTKGGNNTCGVDYFNLILSLIHI